MAYQRKTKDWYEIYGWYETGWEFLCAEETHQQAIETCKSYYENEHIVTAIKKAREKLEKDGEK